MLPVLSLWILLFCSDVTIDLKRLLGILAALTLRYFSVLRENEKVFGGVNTVLKLCSLTFEVKIIFAFYEISLQLSDG